MLTTLFFSSVCEAPWQLLTNSSLSRESRCVLYVHEPQETRDGARAKCADKNGRLLVIENEATWNLVSNSGSYSVFCFNWALIEFLHAFCAHCHCDWFSDVLFLRALYLGRFEGKNCNYMHCKHKSLYIFHEIMVNCEFIINIIIIITIIIIIINIIIIIIMIITIIIIVIIIIIIIIIIIFTNIIISISIYWISSCASNFVCVTCLCIYCRYKIIQLCTNIKNILHIFYCIDLQGKFGWLGLNLSASNSWSWLDESNTPITWSRWTSTPVTPPSGVPLHCAFLDLNNPFAQGFTQYICDNKRHYFCEKWTSLAMIPGQFYPVYVWQQRYYFCEKWTSLAWIPGQFYHSIFVTIKVIISVRNEHAWCGYLASFIQFICDSKWIISVRNKQARQEFINLKVWRVSKIKYLVLN